MKRRGKRLGTVLVFKEGTTEAEAKAALSKIADVLEPGHWVDYPKKNGRPDYSKPIPATYVVHEFEAEYGGPVWYIP